ncbi:AGC/PKC protein kinase [Microdochium trichocladiopsis]|uniref:Protein kinase C-like n=1 Tax=Microdochium trichocladiopsis TaxID=1682393 RepID=A0A9P8Y6N9_9PEZI|nr:AGC/PKC protein kinase [Microdochium trichocladiopsis]KAH7031150.1 AGC/PKC protein kinase [Microdochium trichocladiopsis]
MMNEDEQIANIQKKVDKERVLLNAAQAMLQQTPNADVRSRLNNQMRDGRRNIQFFEEKIRDLQMKRLGHNVDNMSISSGSTAVGSGSVRPASQGGPPPPPKDAGNWGGDRGSYGSGSVQYSEIGGHGDMMPPRHPYAPPGPGAGVPKSRPNFTKLDLIKYDSPYMGPRIQLMLSQIQFKLNVEEQYLKGIEKMVQLYNMEGDRKSKADAAARHVESKQKIQLLKQALKRYEELHIDDIEVADQLDDDSINMPNLRKPLTGQLAIRVIQVRDVDHASTGRFSRGPETFVAVKVEDNIVARTRIARGDRWEAEYHNIDVDKANEVELTVYDKPGEHAIPIGMLWIRISDIVEEMRRKKIEAEMTNSGWVSADRMGGQDAGGPPSQFPMSPTQQQSFGAGATSPGLQGGQGQAQFGPQAVPQVTSQPIDAWFNLEPAGSIHLALDFIKQNKDRRQVDLGLGRKGAVRQRKEEVHEMYGHKFVQHQFYNIMRCALCGDFLKYSAGMQCEDCKYTCHQKCYGSVVTKCISKSNAETDPDEEKINHRIPHRFQAFSNVTANWCCHCGYMLPFGKKNCRKCSECNLTAHAGCVHLVPDFCGMSMATANQILEGMRVQRQRQQKVTSLTDKTLRQGKASPASSQTPSSPYSSHAPSYQPSVSSQEATEAAKAMYGAQISPQRPTHPDRTSSGQSAAAAAASAAMSGASAYGGRPSHGQDYASGRTGSYSSPDGQDDPYSSAASQNYNKSTAPLPYNPASFANVDNNYGQPPVQQHRPSAGPIPQQPTSPSYGYQQQQQQQQQPQHDKPAYASSPAPQKPQAVVQETPSLSSPHGIPGASRKPLPSATDPGTGQRIGLDHFNFLAVLGKGNFGKVMLAETKKSRRLYAIKVLKKEFIIENDEVESTRSEKRVFLIANRERHPFLTNLHACFQTETRVYFVMEYISGGDLMWHIQRGQFGTKRAQFYAAEVCLALKYFHENGVIYRDLKLDNILLTLDGHIKIGDYGLCKEDMWFGSTTSTFCGTPEFMAPEILLDKKYGRAVDWWAFGVLIYQMLLQQSPFRGEDEDEIYDAILADEPLYPIHMPRDSVSILQKLLTREPDQRLGSGPTDAQEVMSQPFFRNVNWEDIFHKRVAPPFMPTIKNATDTSNFDSEFTSVTPVLTPVNSGKQAYI